MRNLVVVAFALLLAYYGPQQDHTHRFDAAWMLGALALLAAVGGQLAQRLGLPAVVGWLVAGLVLGASGLQVVRPDALSIHQLLLLFTGLWVGFHVGLNVVWPRSLDWRGPVLMAVATLLVFLAVTAAVALLVEPPWGVALLIGALASMWGPFTGVPATQRRGALLLAVLGAGASLLLLSGVLVLLESEAVVEAGASLWAARVWLALLAGGGLGVVLRLLGLFVGPASTLFAGLMVAFLSASLALEEWGLPALPCGLAVGLALRRHPLQNRRVRLLLHRAAPAAFMLFFALLGTSLKLDILWPVADGLLEVALVMAAAPLFLRGLAPIAYYPLPAPDPGPGRRIGWQLLPRGALLFELFYGPHGLGQYAGSGGLLGQAVLVDILLSALLFSALASLLGERVVWPRSAPEPESVPAA